MHREFLFFDTFHPLILYQLVLDMGLLANSRHCTRSEPHFPLASYLLNEYLALRVRRKIVDQGENSVLLAA